jgi:hypothetical protein
LLVAGLYCLILAALTVPVITLAFAPKTNWKETVELYAHWQYWLWLVTLGASQLALLAVPVRVASRRPVTKGALWPTLLAGGLMLGGLVTGACCALYEFVFRDKGNGNWIGWGAIALGVLTWCFWLMVFFRMSKSASAADLVSRQCRWLLKGSILELLIAVPTHIVARSREYCCAGFMTFFGLTMGVSVMLFAFGPAVFFLYVERWKRLHPDPGTAQGPGGVPPLLPDLQP